MEIVESIIGPGVSVFFSQIFFKAPEGGGPKPAHQDNFYFGPNDPEGVVTAWVALDDATLENGCLYFGDGTNRGPVYTHGAPADEPFNLQLPAAILQRQPMSPAPVTSGGVSFHHGNTFHQSAPNLSTRWRRACALHYVNAHTFFEHPALPYDDAPDAAHQLSDGTNHTPWVRRPHPHETTPHEHTTPRHHHARRDRPHGHEPAPDPLDRRDPQPGRRDARQRRHA